MEPLEAKLQAAVTEYATASLRGPAMGLKDVLQVVLVVLKAILNVVGPDTPVGRYLAMAIAALEAIIKVL